MPSILTEILAQLGDFFDSLGYGGPEVSEWSGPLTGKIYTGEFSSPKGMRVSISVNQALETSRWSVTSLIINPKGDKIGVRNWFTKHDNEDLNASLTQNEGQLDDEFLRTAITVLIEAYCGGLRPILQGEDWEYVPIYGYND